MNGQDVNGDAPTGETACDRLLDFVYGDLDEAEAARFAEHLASCARCQAEQAAFGRVRGAFREALPAEEPPAALSGPLHAQLLHAAAQRKPKRGVVVSLFRAVAAHPALAAAATFLVVGGAIGLQWTLGGSLTMPAPPPSREAPTAGEPAPVAAAPSAVAPAEDKAAAAPGVAAPQAGDPAGHAAVAGKVASADRGEASDDVLGGLDSGNLGPGNKSAKGGFDKRAYGAKSDSAKLEVTKNHAPAKEEAAPADAKQYPAPARATAAPATRSAGGRGGIVAGLSRDGVGAGPTTPPADVSPSASGYGSGLAAKKAKKAASRSVAAEADQAIDVSEGAPAAAAPAPPPALKQPIAGYGRTGSDEARGDDGKAQSQRPASAKPQPPAQVYRLTEKDANASSVQAKPEDRQKLAQSQAPPPPTQAPPQAQTQTPVWARPSRPAPANEMPDALDTRNAQANYPAGSLRHVESETPGLQRGSVDRRQHSVDLRQQAATAARDGDCARALDAYRRLGDETRSLPAAERALYARCLAEAGQDAEAEEQLSTLRAQKRASPAQLDAVQNALERNRKLKVQNAERAAEPSQAPAPAKAKAQKK